MPNDSLQQVQVLGVPVNRLTMTSAIALADQLCQRPEPKPASIIAVNPEKVMTSLRDPQVKRYLEESDILIPDGIGVVWAVNRQGGEKISRVAGCDLMQELCVLASQKGYGVFLYGASPESNALAAEKLQQRLPKLQIKGTAHGYISAEEKAGLAQTINQSGADIVFVALGSPKQEEWIRSNVDTLKVHICQGVGGSFDVVAGLVERAPESWQRLHLEWAFRLFKEPKRIFRQFALLKFFWLCLIQKPT